MLLPYTLEMKVKMDQAKPHKQTLTQYQEPSGTEENMAAISQWLSLYGRPLATGLAIAILCLGGLLWYQSNYIQTSYNDFATARNLSEGVALGEDDSLTKLLALTSHHPELETRYGGLLIENLIISNRPEAQALLANFLNKNPANPLLKPYQDYSTTTGTQIKKEAAKALEEARSLQAALDAQGATESLVQLKLFNLLRLSTLAKENGKTQEAQKALEQLRAIEAKNPAAYKKFAALFQEGTVTLNDL
jgi:hypothetical protein